MAEFVAPTQDEVYRYFVDKLKDETIALSMSNRYYYYSTHNDWTMKKGKKRIPLKNWKLNINTWIRNMPKYSPVENVQLISKRVYNDNQ